MLLKIVLGFTAGLVLFLGYVSTRPSHFHYERSGVIAAAPAKVYAVVSDFKNGQTWNPFDQKDPAMKREFSGVGGQVGSKMVFDGNRDAGAGTLEMMRLVSDQLVEIKLTMTRPIHAENTVRYTLAPEGAGTRFTWAMEGDGGFPAKLISVFLDCEKMITPEFEKGIAQLKTLVERQ